jgi:hypothetical protein
MSFEALVALNLTHGLTYLLCLWFYYVTAQYSLAFHVYTTHAKRHDIQRWQKRLKFPFTPFKNEALINRILVGYYNKDLNSSRLWGLTIVSFLSIITVFTTINLNNAGNILNTLWWISLYVFTDIGTWNFGRKVADEIDLPK